MERAGARAGRSGPRPRSRPARTVSQQPAAATGERRRRAAGGGWRSGGGRRGLTYGVEDADGGLAVGGEQGLRALELQHRRRRHLTAPSLPPHRQARKRPAEATPHPWPRGMTGVVVQVRRPRDGGWRRGRGPGKERAGAGEGRRGLAEGAGSGEKGRGLGKGLVGGHRASVGQRGDPLWLRGLAWGDGPPKAPPTRGSKFPQPVLGAGACPPGVTP